MIFLPAILSFPPYKNEMQHLFCLGRCCISFFASGPACKKALDKSFRVIIITKDNYHKQLSERTFYDDRAYQAADGYLLSGKACRDLLPPLPDGVTSSYIQYLDVIQRLEAKGVRARVSDLSDALNLPRPGVTRTVKEMERKGYLQKQVSAEDGRVTYLLLTDAGRLLSKKYDSDYFQSLVPCLDDIPEADAECTIRTIEKFYQVMCERRNVHEK